MNVKTVKVLVRFPEGDVEVVPVVVDFSERTNLKNTKSWEDGSWKFYNTWERLDGKVDSYYDIVKEGVSNGLN